MQFDDRHFWVRLLNEAEMCAQVLKFRKPKADVEAVVESPAVDDVSVPFSSPIEDDSASMQFWVGASGQRYIHTVHSLLLCPEIPAVNYLLIHRTENGEQKVLAAGHTIHDAPSLNLADVRKHGATVGANEVHIHLLADSVNAAKLIEHDLKQAQLGHTLPPDSLASH